MNCFWPQCSDRKRCEAHGSCVAKTQAGGAAWPKPFDPDADKISDLVAAVGPPTDEQLKIGLLALDDYYEGTKDAPFEGSVAYVYRAMRALERG